MDATELAQELTVAALDAGLGQSTDPEGFYAEASFIITRPDGRQFYVKISPHEPQPVCVACGDLVHEGSNGVWYGSDSDPECYGEDSQGTHIPATPVPAAEVAEALGEN